MFTITETTSTTRYYSNDGVNGFSTEADAQGHNAELAAVKKFGKSFFDDYKTSWCYTTLRNMAMRMPVADLILLRGMMDDYLISVLPVFEALEGPFSHGLGKKQIKTDDGRSFTDRREAAQHILRGRFEKLWQSSQMSVEGRKVICNLTQYNDHLDPRHKGDYSQYRFVDRLMNFLARTTEAGHPRKGDSQRFRDALDAMITARTTPVLPTVKIAKAKAAA